VLVRADTFAYDALGNRQDHGGAIATGNRLTSFDGFSQSYDDDGNLTSRSKTGYLQEFFWNSLNQLDSVRTNGFTVRFSYDGLGRRIRKSSDTSDVVYVFDASHIVAELDGVSGQWRRHYSYYPGIDVLHSMEVASVNGGATTWVPYYALSDQLGSVMALIDGTGAVVNRYKYSAFGELQLAQESVSNSRRFGGREFDAETGLYFNRSRYYDPHTGRFVSEDPIGLDGGTNLYRYSANDPINSSDPSGLVRCYGDWYASVTRWRDTGEIVNVGTPFFRGFCLPDVKGEPVENPLASDPDFGKKGFSAPGQADTPDVSDEKCQNHIQKLKDILAEIQRRVTFYRDFADRGLNDEFHYNEIQTQKDRWNTELDSYHRDKCNDDDDDFRQLRNAGLQWTRLPLPAPAIPDWRTNRFAPVDATMVRDMSAEQMQAASAGLAALLLMLLRWAALAAAAGA
jgi:RHS repeat-associated protein